MRKIFLILLLIICSYSYAQNENIDSVKNEYKYPLEIIISAPRFNIPLRENSFATSIVGYDFLSSMPKSIAVDEALKLVPGVKVDNQANGERIHLSIRGQGILTERGIRGIKVLLDGLPVNDPTGFAPDLFDVDWATVERIEVLRGTGASLYGGSSSAGILNILTQNGSDKLLSGQGQFSVGSNNFWKGLGQFGATVDKVNYRVSFSRNMGDGYRDHTHFWNNNVYGKATYTPNKNITLTPIFSYTDSYHENPEGINLQQYQENPKQANPDAIPFNEYLETNRITTGLVGSLKVNDMHDFNFNIYSKRTLFTEANNHTFVDRTYLTPGTSVQYNLHFGNKKYKNHISAGTDLQWQTIYEKRVPNDYSVRVNTVVSNETIRQRGLGVFFIDRLELGDKFNFMASVRYDDIKNELTDNLKIPYDASGEAKFNKTTGRFGITYSPVPAVNIYANVGQGFLPPATEELAQNPDNFGGFNTHLIPATSFGEDIGVRGTVGNKLYYDVGLFYLTTNNDFDRYRITDSLRSQETFYKNAGSSRRFGAEVYLRYNPLRELTLQTAYTYSNFKYTNETPNRVVMDDPTIYKYVVDGNYLPNSPQHQFYLDAQYEIVPHLFFGLSTEILSKAYIDGANVEAEAVEGYALFNGRLVYDWNISKFNGQISFNATNLGDKKYVAFSEPDPGGNAYQPGTGRQFYGNLKINF
ncbi:MAG: TonB-dependent receptor [Ignavibacteriae bacterium]|nr:TonB-dependent receptor [Ignavibacteriota bacterium]